MTIIHTYLSRTEYQLLSVKDNDYFRQQLQDHTMLNKLLNKPINKRLLAELECVLDRKPIARRKVEQKNSKVTVYKDGKLVRIENSNGKAIKQLEVPSK